MLYKERIALSERQGWLKINLVGNFCALGLYIQMLFLSTKNLEQQLQIGFPMNSL